MTEPDAPKLVFLLDVDNTLLDNDRLKADLQRDILESLGPERADRFWQIYEDVRAEGDYVDYPTTIERIVDDKPRITAALEKMCPTTFTTILVLQGKYAQAAGEYSPKHDIVVERIGDLRTFGREQFLASARADVVPG